MSTNLVVRLAILLAATALAMPAAASAKKPHRLAPPVPCTMANRMDVFVDEDLILWECTCEALKSGHICKWQVIGGVDAVTAKRKHLKPKRAIAYTIPAVIA